MWQLKELVEKAKLVKQLKRRRMDRISAEIAEKIRMLLKHGNRKARPASKRPSMMPAGPPPIIQVLCMQKTLAECVGPKALSGTPIQETVQPS